ncbi:MAG: LuxR C-terminal-related transcriptional regulator [Treponema sp.]|jgi:LuxR family maltose regulon positive regulatory protein|nr:LuxR C-terminal-related transcriptional regulator [Treponema sp.]
MPERQFPGNVRLPPGNQVYLERPRIDVLLEKAVQNRLVLVVAGAGYGKTHAVYSFVRKNKALTSWLQFSERDNITSRFWESFVAGVALSSPKAASQLAKLDFPETERQFERYISIPQEELDPADHIIFVYDDFHFIQNPMILRFLEKSLSVPLPSVTAILVSRSDPSLNVMQFLSKGVMERITEEDLRFSREEMTEYFSMQNIRPMPETLSSIYHDTEGWAFAIHLAGLSLKNAPPEAPYVPQAMRKNIFMLIESEVMGTVSQAVQQFLIKLSLIDHLFSELLNDIAGDPEIIKEMGCIDSFIRFDTYQNEYHIHHLFLDYLKTRQDEIPEEARKELWDMTAAWCEANNQKIDAIIYYEKAGDYDQLIAVCNTLPMMYSDRIARMLLEILDKAPPEVYERNPLIYTHRLRIAMSLGMMGQAEKETLEAIARFEALPPSSTNHKILAVCYSNKGFIGLMVAPYTREYNFIVDFERCAWHGRQSGGWVVPFPLSVLPIGSFMCRVTRPDKGDIERYVDALEAVAPLTTVVLGGMEWGADTLARAEFALFRGDLAEAEQLALETLKRARTWDQYEIENRALHYLLRIHVARGNWEGIQDVFKQLEAQLDKVYYVNRFTFFDIVTGSYYARIGLMDRVARWLKNDFEGSDLNSMNLGLEVLVKARCHLVEKRYPAALAALSVISNRSNPYDAGDFLFGMVIGKAMEAVCRYRMRDKSGAFAALEQAYRLASPNGLDMPFIELGKDMRSLVEAALKDPASAADTAIPRDWLEKIRLGASAFAKKLFVIAERYRTEEGGTAAHPSPGGQTALSRREKEVLTAILQGMTREEIAALTSLSANTIKSVTRSVYNKLGALNKADAVRIASGMDLS